MSFKALEEIVNITKKTDRPFWEVVLAEELSESQQTRAEALAKMENLYQAMKEADQNYDSLLKSPSRLVGGDGEKIARAIENGTMICGDFIGRVIAKAIKMGESNACMKRIVAAPTAGSCGVIPAVLLTYAEQNEIDEMRIIEALFVAAGIGEIIAHRAFIAGATGGCQAEIGSASAMAAGALAYLRDGDADTIVHAAALALKSLLGLACDPVAGLVEVPCVKRNVIGAVNALTSVDMALAGIRSQIPPDQVIDAMRLIGNAMPAALKETGEGGLAITPTGLAIAKGLKE
ncbi:L-serine ammonia-lyase, iron-sulfur-dependent, subunit alpha [Acetobacterium fimetarium]|uniref:L-serine dehydratase n=1 Tax=Acetobacterium fimetarium TaxID=52691 RepID=A0ABR6WVK2_9FIRM|nr:L-serine ammonia-lyase, iron-sulfur-dependent, subunit alpha [Acetobacterium fimetarium]MBC3804239.1 L-serine ammonia-lyase, iron-sulfur-dependent, subunit alpha [Acetobacterium fimetarium]